MKSLLLNKKNIYLKKKKKNRERNGLEELRENLELLRNK
jgi:hypothetical protein